MWGRRGAPHNFLLAFINERWKTRKIRLLKKWKNLLEISSFYTCVPKPRSYEVEFLRSKVRQNFLSFWAIFCSFARLLTLKIKIWEKCKKTPEDIILLHMCTINQDQMHPWYDTWFLRNEVQQTELSWIILKISKMKKNLEMSSFYTNVPKMMSIR